MTLFYTISRIFMNEIIISSFYFTCCKFFYLYRVRYDKNGIDPDNDNHEEYLSSFKNKCIEKLRNCIDLSLTNDPDGGKGRKKTVQVSR